MCAPTASRRRPTSRAARSACRNISSPPMCGRASFLEDDYGVKPSDIHWIRGGIEHAGRPEKITIKLPPGVRLDNAPEGKTISALLAERRDRRLHRAAPADASSRRATRISAGCFPIRPRSPRTISSAPASSRSCTSVGIRRDTGRKASVAAGRGAQGVRAVERGGAGEVVRYLRHQGDAAVRRGAARRSARR